MNQIRPATRSVNRRLHRRLSRPLAHSCVRRVIPRRRGPDELSQALTAFGRAIRCHRRIAKLAPRFFDSAVVDQEILYRAERRRWMALWEPALNQAYGLDPDAKSAPPLDDLPPLPSPSIQRAVDRELTEWQRWMDAGRLAMELYRQRHPHALPSFTQIARLLQAATEFSRLACGVDGSSPVPPAPDNYDRVWADLQRAYPQSHDVVTPPPVPAPPPMSPAVAPSPSPVRQPVDEKRDLIPHRLVRGWHGLLCLEPLHPEESP